MPGCPEIGSTKQMEAIGKFPICYSDTVTSIHRPDAYINKFG